MQERGQGEGRRECSEAGEGGQRVVPGKYARSHPRECVAHIVVQGRAEQSRRLISSTQFCSISRGGSELGRPTGVAAAIAGGKGKVCSFQTCQLVYFSTI